MGTVPAKIQSSEHVGGKGADSFAWAREDL